MVIKMNNKIKVSIIIVVATVFIAIASIVYRNASYTQTWLVCESDIAAHYHETMKFRFDINNKLYGFYREELIHDVSDSALEENYKMFKEQYDKIKDELDDNVQYEIINENKKILVKTYIGVSVYPSFFNKFINNQNITTSKTPDEIKSFLESNNYKCEVTKK